MAVKQISDFRTVAIKFEFESHTFGIQIFKSLNEICPLFSVILATFTQSIVCIFHSGGWYPSNVGQCHTQGTDILPQI